MSNSDRDPVSDGGSVTKSTKGEAPFDLVSSGTMTRWERYKVVFDEWVVAPLVIMWDDYRSRIGGAIILLFVLMGTVGVRLFPSPEIEQGTRLQKPLEDSTFPTSFSSFGSETYLFGTDSLGNDLFLQTIHATPPMLEMILAGAVFTTVVATAVGTVSGYKRGPVDRVLMTLTDVMMTIPGLPLVIVLAVILEPQRPAIVGIILTINAWAGLARTIRSQVLTIRTESYVEASRLLGIPTHKIILKDIVPGLMPYISVNFVNTARSIIFASVALYFLGILPFSHTNWGVMMNMAYETAGALYTLETAHWLLAPMFTIILFSFGLILFAQGMDRVFNPRTRARHVSPSDEDELGPEEGEEVVANEGTTQV